MSDEALEIAKRALRWYGNQAHYGPDDWGILSVLNKEYGDPGAKARRTLKRIEKLEADPKGRYR